MMTVVGVCVWCAADLGGFAREGAQLFNWHLVLMSVAVLLLLPQGAQIWSLPTPGDAVGHSRGKYGHISLLSTALVIIKVATGIAYVSRRQQGLPNFYSLHSWCGLAVIVVLSSNAILGVASFVFGLGKRWRSSDTVAVHTAGGVLAISLGIITMELGLAEQQSFLIQDKGSPFSRGAIAGNLLGVMCLGIGLAALFLVWERHHPMYDAIVAADSKSSSQGDSESQIPSSGLV